MTPREYLAENGPRFLDELIAFARIPSISTDPAHAADMARAAEWDAHHWSSAGPFSVAVIPTAGNSVVFAEWLGAADAPTILVYGHYDVQPADPIDKWLSDPFEPQVRDGRLYARGVSDDKGPMFIPLKVAQAFFVTRGELPINVKFMLEGEEEIGSPSLEAFISARAQQLRADFVLSADGAMWRIDEPSITVASRGLVALEFSLQTASKDLHSGRYGGSVPNALHALATLVESLHTPDGAVAVRGFYAQVEDLSSAKRQDIAALPFDEERFRMQVGASELFGEPGYGTLERQWTRPTLEVNGMWGGYQGPGSKTVVAHEAHAKITCRLVPRQTPEHIRTLVGRHLQEHLPRGASLRLLPESHGALPYQIPSDHVGLKVAQRVLSDVYGQPALSVRMGGTLPVSELFKRLLAIDTVFFSFSTADEDFHAPNEFFRVQRLYDGLQAWTRYWECLPSH